MVPAFFTDNEIDAELARGMLEANGIAARVRFSAAAGYPRYAVGYGGMGIGAPLSTYEVLVAPERADDARALLAEHVARRRGRPGPWRTWLLRALALFVVATLVYGAAEQLRVLF